MSALRRDGLLVLPGITEQTSEACQVVLLLAPLWRTVLPRDLRMRLESPTARGSAGWLSSNSGPVIGVPSRAAARLSMRDAQQHAVQLRQGPFRSE
jgi:hypothetical protein